MARGKLLKLIIRLGLFSLILGLGTGAALVMDEEEGLALADLGDASVQTMATGVDGNTVFVNLTSDIRPSGLYRSSDNGRTWQVVSSGPGLIFNSLAVYANQPERLYAGTGSGPLGETNNVWRSDDGGQSWHNFNLSLPAGPDRTVPAVTAVLPNPDRPGVLYVGTDGHGVYKFIDGVLGFELVGGTSLADAHVKELAVGTDRRLYALTNAGLFFVAGDTWQKIETLPEVPVNVTVAPSDAARLYVGSPSVGAYRSLDGGQSWEPIGAGLGLTPGASLRVTALVVDEQNPDLVVAAAAFGLGSEFAPNGIYKSDNGGQDWTKLADTESLVEELTLNQDVILASTEKGVLRFALAEEGSPEPVDATGLETLVRPTGVQTLVLALTVSLAGLALIGRPEWVGRR